MSRRKAATLNHIINYYIVKKYLTTRRTNDHVKTRNNLANVIMMVCACYRVNSVLFWISTISSCSISTKILLCSIVISFLLHWYNPFVDTVLLFLLHYIDNPFVDTVFLFLLYYTFIILSLIRALDYHEARLVSLLLPPLDFLHARTMIHIKSVLIGFEATMSCGVK